MRILTFTRLYPSSAQPDQGLFVEHRLRNLIADTGTDARVVAPVPWFPSPSPRFGRYARFARVPRRERRHGIDVEHPRYPVIPRLATYLAPVLLAAGARATIARIRREAYDFQLIDAHFFWPDGPAAVLLARHFDRPVVITARGSDVQAFPEDPVIRRWIVWAASKASGIITVCDALRDALVELGVDANRIRTLRNGVDLEMFRPGPDRERSRAELGFTRSTLLCVGNLVPLKGHDLVIRALERLPDVDLVIAGDGEQREPLARLARSLGAQERVRLVGRIPQDELSRWYEAADALVLASSSEGWANVLLEAMACGTPVAATAVGGSPEVVRDPVAGVLIRDRTPEAIAESCRALLDGPGDRSETRRYAEGFCWRATSFGQSELFESLTHGAT